MIWDDLPVRTFYPDPETLASLSYRSKKAIDGAVRLVEFPGVDLCACCGTHVQHTGEIGLIKLLSSQKFHEGVRIELLCGAPAFSLLARVWRQNKTVAGLFSAKLWRDGCRRRTRGQELEAVKARAARLEETVFAQRPRRSAVRETCCSLRSPCGPTPSGGWPTRCRRPAAGRAGGPSLPTARAASGYAIASPGGNLRDFTKALNQALQGRGGGEAGIRPRARSGRIGRPSRPFSREAAL